MSISTLSTLHVSKFGQASKGPVLVLLHGWGSSSKIWQPCVSQLAEEFHVWCVDLPGHGASSDVVWDYSINEGLKLMANTLPPSSVLIGWSLGGLIAQLFTHQYLERVQALMLIASTPRFVTDEDWPQAWPHAMPTDTFEQFVMQYDHSPQETLKQFIALQTLHGSSAKRIMALLQQASSGQQLETEQQNIRWGLDWLFEIDMRETFTSLDIPITLLHGDKDQVSSIRAAKQTAVHFDQVQLCNIPGAGHVPFLSHTELFVEQVKRMCAQVAKGVNAK